MSGFAGCRRNVVHRVARLGRAAGAALGRTCGGVAVRAAIGPALGMVAPTITAAIHWGDWRHPLYVLILYAGIVVVDTLVLQPYVMKRTTKVPIWASILVPIVLAFVIPFWGVFLAPPLLAVVYAYKRHLEQGSRKGS